MKLCSFDARSEGQSGDSLGENVMVQRENRRPSPGIMARLGVPVGGRVGNPRRWKINQPPSLKR